MTDHGAHSGQGNELNFLVQFTVDTVQLEMNVTPKLLSLAVYALIGGLYEALCCICIVMMSWYEKKYSAQAVIMEEIAKAKNMPKNIQSMSVSGGIAAASSATRTSGVHLNSLMQRGAKKKVVI
jgi:hypothetical protein